MHIHYLLLLLLSSTGSRRLLLAACRRRRPSRCRLFPAGDFPLAVAIPRFRFRFPIGGFRVVAARLAAVQ